MKPFSDENFELKVYLKYIIDIAKDNKRQKCLLDHINDKNLVELQKFLDKYEFTYVNLCRLATNDQELIPLMKEFIDLYMKVEETVKEIEPEYDANMQEDNINRMSYAELDKYVSKKMVLIKEEGNDNNE